MSEFSKLASRIESISEVLLALDSAYPPADDGLTDSGDKRLHVQTVPSISEISVKVGVPYISSNTAPQTMSTTGSATPGIRDQYAWRSSSSAAPSDKDQYLSINGQQLFTDYDTALSLRDEMITKLVPSCDQFLLKADTKDSVTDLPRYGAAMRAKIIAASEKCCGSLKLVLQLIERMNQLVQDENEMKKRRISIAEKEAFEQQQSLLLATTVLETKSSAETERAIEENRLKCKAEESRQRRRHLNGILLQLLCTLNRREQNERTVKDAVHRMRAASGDDDTHFKVAIDACISLLLAISARPDSAALRRLRVMHPALRDQITGLDGGTALLLALGFTIKVDPDPNRGAVKEAVGVFSSAGGYVAEERVERRSVAVSENIVRAYARVHVEMDSEGSFVVTTGSDVTQKNILRGQLNLKDPRDEEGTSEEHSEDISGNILVSSDITTWASSHQDLTELIFLANNANSITADKGEAERESEVTAKATKSKEGEVEKEREREKGGDKKPPVPLLLEMAEPNPDTARGMQLWLQWFDGLKHSADMLQSMRT